MTSSILRSTAAVAAMLLAGLFAGSGVAAWAAEDDNAAVEVAPPPAPATPPVDGEKFTIGSWQKDKPAPDLVPIDLEDGRSGFLRTYDLAYGASNPKFIRHVSDFAEEVVLPVYEKDGQTVMGEFVASTATWK